jgi:hypothetical protein
MSMLIVMVWVDLITAELTYVLKIVILPGVFVYGAKVAVSVNSIEALAPFTIESSLSIVHVIF